MRAVTVAVSNQTGVAGFVFPGRPCRPRVDAERVTGQGPELKASETFIRNVRVLATDQKVVSPTRTTRATRKVAVASSVTLEVTPRLAEKIAVAQTIGQLSLSLRSIADNNAELDRAIAAGDVTHAQGCRSENHGGDHGAGGAAATGQQHDLCHGCRRLALSAAHRAAVRIRATLFRLLRIPPDAGTAMTAMVSAMMSKAMPQGPVVTRRARQQRHRSPVGGQVNAS